MMRKAVVAVLTVGLVAQGGRVIVNRQRHDLLTMHGPLANTPMPDVPVQRLSDGRTTRLVDAVRATHTCTMLYFVSAECPVCQRMRFGWGERFAKWSDSVQSPVAQVWVFSSDTAAVRKFLVGFDLGHPTVTSTKDGADAVQKYGVIGTPTSFMIDKAGRVQFGLAGNQLPPAIAARHACGERV
jgi:hypothetical protein